jgi:hypothetical protein
VLDGAYVSSLAVSPTATSVDRNPLSRDVYLLGSYASNASEFSGPWTRHGPDGRKALPVRGSQRAAASLSKYTLFPAPIYTLVSPALNDDIGRRKIILYGNTCNDAASNLPAAAAIIRVRDASGTSNLAQIPLVGYDSAVDLTWTGRVWQSL